MFRCDAATMRASLSANGCARPYPMLSAAHSRYSQFSSHMSSVGPLAETAIAMLSVDRAEHVSTYQPERAS